MNPEIHGYEPTPELSEISEKLLREVFHSEAFQARLKESLNKYQQKKREFGFIVLKEIGNDNLSYGKVIGGANDYEAKLGVSINEEELKLRKQNIESHALIEFHIHPYEGPDDEIIIPSVLNGDLQGTNAERNYVSPIGSEPEIILPPIALVGTPLHDKLKILAYRESLATNPFELEESIEQLDEGMLDVKSQDEVIGLMKQLGYTVEILNATLDCKFDDESLDKLKKFSYLPHYAEGIKY